MARRAVWNNGLGIRVDDVAIGDLDIKIDRLLVGAQRKAHGPVGTAERVQGFRRPVVEIPVDLRREIELIDVKLIRYG